MNWALASSAAAISLNLRSALAYETPSGTDGGRLVVMFLRGGLDGLFAIAPVDDPKLSELRPTLASNVLSNGIRLEQSGFAAHPSCEFLASLFSSKELSFSPCAGTTDKSRSHFEAQDLFELGNGNNHGQTGFLARASGRLGGSKGAISFTREIPLSLQGAETPPEVAPLTGSGLKIPQGRLRDAILRAHGNTVTGEALKQAIETETEIESTMGMEVGASRGAPGANGFPKVAGHMGRILLGNPRLSLVFLDMGGFDTHAAQEGILSRGLQSLSEGLSAFKDSLGPSEWKRTWVVVMSEFGRTVRENGTHGTDHGHGGLAILAGGSVSGGRMLGGFNGLAESSLNENRDLPVLIDWRSLLSESMRVTYGLSDSALDEIFPGRPRGKIVI
jgi:uncharacterized protein (DUF1501 family)